ncbi:hypothetical protein QCA50_016563 [Cerrena zonata]|uniref:Protein kinase domain-containing protein n=1 Tax=Cerrena zonata TaxID=2478898 RepID=A0AAW0FH17_9APHY
MGAQTSAPRTSTAAGLQDKDVKRRETSSSRNMKHRLSVQSLVSKMTKHNKPSKTASSSSAQTVQPASPSTKGATLTKGRETEGNAEQEGRAAEAAPAAIRGGSGTAEMLEPPISESSPMPAPSTVPCQYRTGKTLGSGTYAIVKEAVHIKTGEYFACKVINKKLMEGREYMVRNEIAVLKRVSQGHKNIVTLHDYFETAHNLYLVFDLCTGGELFDRICAKGNYYEADAAELVRTVFKAVKWIHECGIVHRDLKPENLLFRTKKEDADIMIADFGLSRVLEEEKLQVLTEICGTPGYMAPEIFKKTGHGKPVDVWAMGVITYFLLCGYTPFDRDTQQEEMEAIIAGDYKFEPEEYWANVSTAARNFVSYCLTIDPAKRPTAEEALNHKWLADTSPHFVQNGEGMPADLLPHIKRQFDAKKTWKKAVFSITAVKRMTASAKTDHLSAAAQALAPQLEQYKEESEKEIIDEGEAVMHYGNSGEASPTSPKFKAKDHADPLTEKLSKMSIDQTTST